MGGTTYLFVTGGIDDGFSVFRILGDGQLSSVTNVSDNDDLQLDGSSGITTAEVGGKHYIFVAGYDDDGVSVFEFKSR